MSLKQTSRMQTRCLTSKADLFQTTLQVQEGAEFGALVSSSCIVCAKRPRTCSSKELIMSDNLPLTSLDPTTSVRAVPYNEAKEAVQIARQHYPCLKAMPGGKAMRRGPYQSDPQQICHMSAQLIFLVQSSPRWNLYFASLTDTTVLKATADKSCHPLHHSYTD